MKNRIKFHIIGTITGIFLSIFIFGNLERVEAKKVLRDEEGNKIMSEEERRRLDLELLNTSPIFLD